MLQEFERLIIKNSNPPKEVDEVVPNGLIFLDVA